jgi:hypothetical protein
MSFNAGVNGLHGVARFDQIRLDTLVQLVAKWGEPGARDEVIDALDELAGIVHSVRREGELDAAIEQVEDVACMETAHIEIGKPDVRRLLAELAEVDRRLSKGRTQGASLIKHPSHAATRKHLAEHPLPEQQGRRAS